MAVNAIFAQQFFASLAQLTGNEQARVNKFINIFLKNPANPGMNLERINRARSKNVWSGRVSHELRTILYKDGDIWAFLHAAHHDQSYHWAERREIGRHSVTGALQIVESVEKVRKVEHLEAPLLFEVHADDYLLSLGVPESWLPTLRCVRDEEQLLIVCENLPEDVGERLLNLATGNFVTPPKSISVDHPVVDAPDTRRSFFFAEDAEELTAALEAPMERWITFLHPSQRALVEQKFNGPSKVSGSAGTGKTVVAMHRARHLARQNEHVLLTSYVTTLCKNIEQNLNMLCTPSEREMITVSTVHKQALALVRQVEPRFYPAPEDDVRKLIDSLRIRYTPEHDKNFVQSEWNNVVRLQGISSWKEYRSAQRSGRGRKLRAKERKLLWKVFGEALEDLESRDMLDWPGFCRLAEKMLANGRAHSPYTAVVVDEVQDLKPPELRFLSALCSKKPGNFMVCGDTGQRIYPGGFSLSALGIKIHGRASILRINYRTTEQIRRLADRVLGDMSDDMDGGKESRACMRNLLRGPNPRLAGYPSRDIELQAAVSSIHGWLDEGLSSEAIGVLARTGKRIDELGEALSRVDVAWHRLSDKKPSGAQEVQLGTMHRAKGLEFKVVLILGCGDEEIPNPSAMRDADNPHYLEAVEARERRLLYVAMTRARDELTVSWTGEPSRFIASLLEGK